VSFGCFPAVTSEGPDRRCCLTLSGCLFTLHDLLEPHEVVVTSAMIVAGVEAMTFVSHELSRRQATVAAIRQATYKPT
jgi:hypothetical protein